MWIENIESGLRHFYDEIIDDPLLHASSRLYWAYIVLFIAVCLVRFRYLASRADGLPRGVRGFFAFCFPRKVYFHPSAIIDYQVYLLGKLFSPVALLTKWWSLAWVATAVSASLAAWLGPKPEVAWTDARLMAFTLCMVLASDLVTYLNHRLHHQVAWLWPFHRVHHSAEVLTPITLYRKHPFYSVVRNLIAGVLIGLVQGSVAFLFVGKASTIQILGVNLFYLSLFLPLANLRHSHIWVSYGWWLNHILISPAQHQIHHSVLTRHIDKNFGEVFAIWDWMFGTLYVPRAEEQLKIGLLPGEAQPHGSLAKIYLYPFAELGRHLVRKREAAL